MFGENADEVAYLADVFSPSRIVGERYAPTFAAHVVHIGSMNHAATQPTGR